MATESRAFTGRARRRTTRAAVRWTDGVASAVITVGGIGTIAAILLVGIFLLLEVLPLARSAELAEPSAFPAVPRFTAGPKVDEYDMIGWGVDDAGGLSVFRADTGEVISSSPLPTAGRTVTAVAVNDVVDDVAIGLDDGSVLLGTVAFETEFVDIEQADERLLALAVGERTVSGDAVAERTPESQFRLQRVGVAFGGEPLRLADSAVATLDVVNAGTGPRVLVGTADGTVKLSSIRKRRNLFTGVETLLPANEAVLPLPEGPPPLRTLLSDAGRFAYAVWPDGTVRRFVPRGGEGLVAETVDVCPDGAAVTACRMALGRNSLLIGDSTGTASVWFPARPEADGSAEDSDTDRSDAVDDLRLVKGHAFPGGSPVTSFGISARGRVAAIGYEDGRVAMVHTTSERRLATADAGVGTARALALTPRSERSALYVAGGDGLARLDFDEAHPEASLKSLFTPVWYEGYPAPKHEWQSSAGSDDVEPKFGMWPLVFGTLKATLYSLLFGAPLALMAAVYSSEIMPPKWRAGVKPLIENMASLPSVVLGFLAALVFAPFAEEYLSAVLVTPLLVPLALLTAAFVWQLLPLAITLRLEPARLWLSGLAVLGAIRLSADVGPIAEQGLFGGSMIAWLAGTEGSALPGLFLLLIPLAAVFTAFAMKFVLTPTLLSAGRAWPPAVAGLAELGRFVGGTAVALALAYGVASVLAGPLGVDPRGGLFDTFVQRNALVVGFVMGFAIVPIIYTLADDAMRAVPEQLRSASLGAGATPWQTAVRVVVPAATSGLFSALMVGLGRAVGETMIVLMAAGNTPVLDLNVFNGFRTLAANIAVELPEAVAGSTHYRTLYLAALTLFAITFVVNTAAEVVRLRFRRRFGQL